jgi:hypothetical protein
MTAELLPNSNSRKRTRLALKPKMDAERSLLLYLPFKEINELKRKL